MCSVPTRQDSLHRLQDTPEFDLLVIGGGATGAGAALDGALRGLKVACVEREDFSSGTSSRSTKLIWAGSRYLVQALVKLFSFSSLPRPIAACSEFKETFKMVMNCHKERSFLLEAQPHLTNWRAIGVPFTRWILWPAPFGYPPAIFGPMGLFSMFFKFYDGMSGFNCPSSHILSRKRAARIFPQLDISGLKYAQVFYEGQHNDSRTNIAIALSAAEAGAAIANYVEVESMTKDDATGLVNGVTAVDKLSGEKMNIRAKAVLMCGGPFTDQLRELEDPNCKPAVQGAAGIHVVLPSYYCPKNIGLVDMATSDGRFLFFVPWLGHCLVGTTDSPAVPSMRPVPPEEEIDWIIKEASKYLSKGLRVRRSDVLSAWSGVRPLVNDPNAGATSAVSRDHTISVDPNSETVFVAGGKWTTYREMAEDAVDAVIKLKGLEPTEPCSTLTAPLMGREGWHSNLAVELVQDYACSHEVAKHLRDTYGGNASAVLDLSDLTGELWPKRGVQLVPNYPYIESEVRYACRNEMAMTVEDIIARRTRLAYLNVAAARTAIPRVVEIMAEELKWTPEQMRNEIATCHTFLDTFGGPVPRVEEKPSLLPKWTVTQLRDLFDQVDVNSSGALGDAEVSKLAQRLGLNLSKAELSDAMHRMDSDKSGSVEFEEFTDWWHSNKDDDKLQRALAKNFAAAGSLKGSGALFG